MIRSIVLATVVVSLGACAGIVTTPQTFNQRVAYAEGTANALGKTCLTLSRQGALSVPLLVRCTTTVEEGGKMIDVSRGLQGNDRDAQLQAAVKLLQDMQKEIK